MIVTVFRVSTTANAVELRLVQQKHVRVFVAGVRVPVTVRIIVSVMDC